MASELTNKFLAEMQTVFPNNCLYRISDVEKWWGCHRIEAADIGKYNDTKHKAGIFFSPNGDYWLSKWVRQKVNARNVYCFFAEADTQDTFWDDFILQPSIVNKTGRWYHVYRLLDKPYQYTEKWDNIQTDLVWFLWTDAGAKDIARVMRLPWTKYWKDNKGDIIIETIIFETERRYTFSQFDSIFSVRDAKKIQEEAIKTEVGRDGFNIVKTIDARADVADVLHELWWSRWEVKGAAVREDWKKTWWYKYYKAQNALVNFTVHDDYRPVWWPFSVAKKILGSAGEAFDYFMGKYGIGVDRQVTYSVWQETIKIDTEKNQKTLQAGGWEVIFDYELSKTFYSTGKSNIEIMDAVLDPIWWYMNNGVRSYICKYQKPNGQSGTTILSNMVKNNQFETKLAEVWITFLGSKKISKIFISYIHQTTKDYQFTDCAGLYAKDVVVNRIGEYAIEDVEKPMYVQIHDLVSSNRVTNEIFGVEQNITKEDVLHSIENCKWMYEHHISVTVFIHFAMTMFARYIRNLFAFFPAAFMVWLTQSGKTSLRRAMMKSFGIDKCVEVQASTTPFVVLKMMRHYVPLCIWEFQNTDMKTDWDSIIKNNYDCTSNSRGTAWQNLNTYASNAPLIFDWESRSMNNAVYSRSMMFFMNPSYRKKHIRNFKNVIGYFIDKYENINNIWIYFDEQQSFLFEKYEHVDRSEKDRIIDNYALMLAFAKCFDLYDETYESIIWQIETQFSMMWEDNVDKNIKTMLWLANYHDLTIQFVDDILAVKIEFDVDVLKLNEQKIKEMQSQIQTTNHHFNMWYRWYDELCIPLSFLFENTSLHAAANRFFNKISNRVQFDGKCGSAIMAYARKNKYINHRFYQDVIQDANFGINPDDAQWQ